VEKLMAYDSEVHALRQLLLLQNYGGRITRKSDRIMNFPDGPYFFVEISSKEGTKYVIEAYGEEARELERETWRI